MKARSLAVAALVLVLVFFTSYVIGLAARAGLLVESALPIGAIPILGLHFLRAREELAGWAVFTVWLGSTYAAQGDPLELFAFAVVVALALLGLLRSPWFLVAAWIGHILWDFAPRELPALMADLPIACMVFDGLIGAYLTWGARSGRWATRGLPAQTAGG